MIIPKIKVFKKNFNIEISNYLVRFFKKSKKIIITSGKTIAPIYKNIDKLNFENKLFYLSDERLVSYNSKLSNFRNISKYNFVNKNKLFHFNINKKFSKKKTDFFLNKISKIKKFDFSILTVGNNCHIASIFFDNKTKLNQYYFFNKVDRVSLSLKIINKSKKIFLLCNKQHRALELALNLKDKKKLFKFLNIKKLIILFDKKSYKSFNQALLSK
jgi:6-phosphogluconolactonase/glucosamine-6-phosphate isomerase/deaminase